MEPVRHRYLPAQCRSGHRARHPAEQRARQSDAESGGRSELPVGATAHRAGAGRIPDEPDAVCHRHYEHGQPDTADVRHHATGPLRHSLREFLLERFYRHAFQNVHAGWLRGDRQCEFGGHCHLCCRASGGREFHYRPPDADVFSGGFHAEQNGFHRRCIHGR